MTDHEHIKPALTERVLERLGMAQLPSIDEAALTAVYRRWCQSIPFDNILKRIQACSGVQGPLPGATPTEFFDTWLATGAGGTCWAGNGALYALLKTLGFPARRGLSTMVAQSRQHLTGPVPRHGTVVVDFGDGPLIVDATMMHDQPIRLAPGASEHPVWGTAVHRLDEHWHIRWKPLGRPHVDCRVEDLQVPADTFHVQHEISRDISRFNQAIICRLGRPDQLHGIVLGNKVVRGPDGTETFAPLDTEAMRKLLVEEFGISEQLADSIPDNDVTS